MADKSKRSRSVSLKHQMMSQYDQQDTHAKRERSKARELKRSQWWKLKVNSSPPCHYCKKVLLPEEVTMDHLVPVSRGGKTTKLNIVISCYECNQSKSDGLFIELNIDPESK